MGGGGSSTYTLRMQKYFVQPILTGFAKIMKDRLCDTLHFLPPALFLPARHLRKGDSLVAEPGWKNRTLVTLSLLFSRTQWRGGGGKKENEKLRSSHREISSERSLCLRNEVNPPSSQPPSLPASQLLRHGLFRHLNLLKLAPTSLWVALVLIGVPLEHHLLVRLLEPGTLGLLVELVKVR